MTEEKMRKGEESFKESSYLKNQKQKEVCTIGNQGRVQNSMGMDDSFINFDGIKLLAIARIDRRISEVQREFDEL